MNKKGFAPILVVLLVVVGVAVVGSFYYYFHRNSAPTASQPVPPVVVATSTTPTSTTQTSTNPITSMGYRSYLTPSSGPVGTIVTIHGSGFAATGNQVTLNGMVASGLADLSSSDGKTITFGIPSSLGPNCKLDQACPMYMMVVGVGSYNVSVITNGVTRSIGVFTVTGGGGIMIPASTTATTSLGGI